MIRDLVNDWTTNMAMRTIMGMDITITTVIRGTAIPMSMAIHTITGINDRNGGCSIKPAARSTWNMLLPHLAVTAK